MKESFKGTREVNIGGSRIESISFADVAVITESKEALTKMINNIEIVRAKNTTCFSGVIVFGLFFFF